jgi:hypothetical protein
MLTILASDTGNKRCGHKGHESRTPTVTPAAEPYTPLLHATDTIRAIMQTVRRRTIRCH